MKLVTNTLPQIMLSYQTKNIPLSASIKDVDGKKGIITGYFAHFNSLDSDGDVIIPGAFNKTIAERGPLSTQPRVKHLRNHLVYEPVGTITALKEDTKGLYYESIPGTHFIGQDTVKMIESGLVTEHSFGFEVVKKETIKEGNGLLQEGRERKLMELKLWEGSVLSGWGANERTGAAMMKSMGKQAYTKMLSDRATALEKFCRNTTATEETIEMLLLESKQLTQIILDIQTTATKPELKSTLPEEWKGWIKAGQVLIKN